MSALRWGLVCLLSLGFAANAAAKGVRGVSPDGKKGWLHVVEKGDTLWDISETYLGTPWIWPSVWKDNEIEDPDVIKPGDFIWITEKEMRKLTAEEVEQIRLGIDEEGDGSEGDPAGLDPNERGPAVAPVEDTYYDPFAALDQSIGETRRLIDFPGLHRMGFLTPEEEEGAAAILGSHDEGYWTSQERRTIVSIGEGRAHVGDMFTIFRTQRRVRHPDTGEVLGYLVNRLGTAEVTEIHTESSYARIVSAYSEIQPGDRLVPYVEEQQEFETIYDDRRREGVIVAMQVNRQYALNGDLIVLDHGSDAGLVIGHEFQVYRAGKTVRDPVSTAKTLVPDDIIGEIVVLKTGATASLALLTRANRPIRIGDRYRSN